MPKRNIKVAAAPVIAGAAHKSVTPVRKIVVGKKAKPIASAKVAAPTAPRSGKSQRIVYDVPVSYAGMSPYVNKRKSRTVIPVAEFGSQPDMTLTTRTENALKDWNAQFGNKPFARGNLDAGVLKLLGKKGFLQHVSGDEVAESAQFRFTTAAMNYHVA